jgi:putative mRNA 3-end processing factor
MQLRGARRRQGLDRGFVLSDHADWPGLQRAIAATGASRVIVTHGYEAVMVRWLQQQGLQAGSFQTAYGDTGGAGDGEELPVPQVSLEGKAEGVAEGEPASLPTPQADAELTQAGTDLPR